ncbi:MAG: hypothetical protein R3C42_01115 [Parvularculaceae bacterium]
MFEKSKILGLVLGAAAILPADCWAAKQFNQSPFLPAREQAMVARVQAGIAAKAKETGEHGLFDRDCDQNAQQDGKVADRGFTRPQSPVSANGGNLLIGAQSGLTRPKEQIIVADTIINVGGYCRMRR